MVQHNMVEQRVKARASGLLLVTAHLSGDTMTRSSGSTIPALPDRTLHIYKQLMISEQYVYMLHMKGPKSGI